MATVHRIKGVANVIKKLRQHSAKVAKGCEVGLKNAGLELQRLSQEIVPVDLGDLRGDAFTRVKGSGFKAVVTVGYTKDYALAVHEELDKAHGSAYNTKYAVQIATGATYWYKGKWRPYHPRRPQEQAKFLEQPARQYKDHLATIVKDDVKRYASK